MTQSQSYKQKAPSFANLSHKNRCIRFDFTYTSIFIPANSSCTPLFYCKTGPENLSISLYSSSVFFPVITSYIQLLSASSSFFTNVSLRAVKAGIKLSRINRIISSTSSSLYIWTEVFLFFSISSHTSESLINPIL